HSEDLDPDDERLREAQMMADFNALIKGYGYNTWMAPGPLQVLAELANLNMKGAIDVVLTTDAAIFCFDVRNVIRLDLGLQAATDPVEIYSSRALMRRGFSRAFLFFITVVVRGTDCTAEIAYALADSALPVILLYATETMELEELRDVLLRWHIQFCNELAHNPHQVLDQAYPSLVAQVPEDFPSVQVVRAYVRSPIFTSIFGTPVCKPTRPNTAQLAHLYRKLFGWHGDDLVWHLVSSVWTGECLQDLCQHSRAARHEGLGRNAIQQIHSVKFRDKSHSAFPSYLVTIWITSVMPVAMEAIRAAYPEEPIQGASNVSASLWIPAPILLSAAPDLVGEFHNRKAWLTADELYLPAIEK
ncbi:hypothetical protein DXG01_016251, partial [Tephrocybe rancida]